MNKKKVFICGAGILTGKKESASGNREIYTICDEDYESLITSPQLRGMDRISKLAFAAASLALKNSNIFIEKGSRNDYGIFLGTEYSSLCSIHNFDMVSVEKGALSVNPAHFPNTVLNSPACQVGIQLSIAGPVFTVCNGLNSGLDALGLGYHYIRSGLSSLILAGGVDEFSEIHSLIHKTFMPVCEASSFAVLAGEDIIHEKSLNLMAEVTGYKSLTLADINTLNDNKFNLIGKWVDEVLLSLGIEYRNIGGISIGTDFNSENKNKIIQILKESLKYYGYIHCVDIDYMSACGVLQIIWMCGSCCRSSENKSKRVILNISEKSISLLVLDVLGAGQ